MLRNNATTDIRYVDTPIERRSFQVLRGNSNTYLVEKQKLDLPFVASKVRFVPYSQHPRTVCMRVEIYGCVLEREHFYTVYFTVCLIV